MGIFNKRNALFGWASWEVAKRVLKRKRKKKAVVPAPVAEVAAKATNRKAIAGLLAAIVGLVSFKRARSSRKGDGTDDAKK
jgi:hypothetical protein